MVASHFMFSEFLLNHCKLNLHMNNNTRYWCYGYCYKNNYYCRQQNSD